MKKIILIPDSFKGTLSSVQICKILKDTFLKFFPTAQITAIPVADGGEGTVDCFLSALSGEKIFVNCKGPYMEDITAFYGLLSGGETAVVEMAAAAGLPMVEDRKNPLLTTTYGVGELINDAIGKGCRRFLVGIGGSATNDGGTGMLTALGYEFLDRNDDPIPLGGKGLKDLHRIKTHKVLPELGECSFQIACDVTNPLCGELGCSAVYGPQKGATADMIRDMDGWLANYARLAKTVSAKADAQAAGAGAAGGLGFAFLAFTNAVLRSGVETVLEETNLEAEVKTADIVVTGEGRLDSQTVMGKAPIGVARLAKRYGKKVIAFSGCVTEEAEVCNDHGIDAFFPVLRPVTTLEEALEPARAGKKLTATAYQVFRLLGL
jgi:glycerate kinase